MGFKAVKVVLSMEREVHLTFDELLEYKEQMEQLANDTYENIIKGDRHVVENFIEIFSSLSNRKNCGGCALYNDRVMVVAPDGEEFKCYKQISANMREQEHRFMEKCDNCWAVSLCDEGCPLDHKIFTDDFYKRSEELCNRSKCIYNVALKLYIRFSEVGADKLKNIFCGGIAMMSNDYTVKVGEDWYTYVSDTGDIEKNGHVWEKNIYTDFTGISTRMKLDITEEQWIRGEVVQSLWLSISHICNMVCEYCFAQDGTYGTASLMNWETAKRAIDFFFEYLKKDVRKIRVNFLAGSPC